MVLQVFWFYLLQYKVSTDILRVFSDVLLSCNLGHDKKAEEKEVEVESWQECRSSHDESFLSKDRSQKNLHDPPTFLIG